MSTAYPRELIGYGSRTGVWRLLKLFANYDIPLTVFAVAMALERHPDVAKAFVDENEEREHLNKAIKIITDLTGKRPTGWYTGCLGPNTRRLVIEEGTTAPKMMSVGLHCRLVGRPGRIASLKRFLEYVKQHDDVWLCTREQIAQHWIANHPASSLADLKAQEA